VRIAVLDDIHRAWETAPAVARMRERATVDVFTAAVDAARLRGYEVLIANRERTRFTRELLAQLPDLRLVIQTGNHANHVDFAAADELRIAVARASAGYSIGAAELAIGLAIGVMRQVVSSDAAIRRGEWSTPSTPVLHGKTLGIVGLGGVGRHVARIAGAFGMEVLAWSPRLTAAKASESRATRRELDDLLRESDVVSIHASLTPESRGLIDARRLALMKPTAYLVNTARGAIVDEAALVEALGTHRIAGAGLDVFDREPLPAGHPLTTLSNVVLTAHLGWPTDDGYQRFADAAAEVLFAYLDGRDMPAFAGH
jgi:phosphoglycerate dehydrogenase-like enzyme